MTPATRKKIDNAVRRTGYIRNRAAQTMHGIRSGTIGLVVPTLDHTIFAEVVQAFASAVEQKGFTILLASHGYDLEKEYAVLRKFLEHRVDGVAVVGLDHSDETYELIEHQMIPAISLWNFSDESRLSCVGADNRAAGRLATQHLIDLGHQQIAIVFPPIQGNDRAHHRLEAAHERLAATSIAVPKPWIVEAPYSIADAKHAVASMLQANDKPSAILCGNDVLALGALYAARRCGFHVPDDVSIIGIGDFKGSGDHEPALTTVRLPAQRIGRAAGEVLSRTIIDSSTETVRLSFDLELLARETCKPF